jgi:hypothetical protein
VVHGNRTGSDPPPRMDPLLTGAYGPQIGMSRAGLLKDRANAASTACRPICGPDAAPAPQHAIANVDASDLAGATDRRRPCPDYGGDHGAHRQEGSVMGLATITIRLLVETEDRAEASEACVMSTWNTSRSAHE